jgi:hypothetical protein
MLIPQIFLCVRHFDQAHLSPKVAQISNLPFAELYSAARIG